MGQLKTASKYIAVHGISFEGLKPPVRCEPGDPIPEKVDAATLKDLLENGDIQEVA